MIAYKEWEVPTSPVLQAVRWYTICLLVAISSITVVLLLFQCVRGGVTHALVAFPFVSLLITCPYLFLLLLTTRKKIAPWARFVYAIAATGIVLLGVLALLDDPFDDGYVFVTWQYAAALCVVTIGAAAETVEAMLSRKQ